MTANLMGILIIETQDQSCKRVVLIQRFLQLPTDKRQLEVEEISMTRLQIVHQGLNTDLLVGLKLAITVDGIVNHRQKSIGIYIIILTSLLHRLVAKAQTDTEAAKRLQQVIIIADQGNHLVIRLIHLLIFHRRMLPNNDYRVQR